MTVRSGDDDDNTVPFLPEVTVPPWLRTGPSAEPSVSGPAPAAGSAAAGGDTVAGASGTGRNEVADRGVPPEAPPTRITLGAQGRDGAPEGAPAPAGSAHAGHRPPVDDLSTLPLQSGSALPGSTPTGSPLAGSTLTGVTAESARATAPGVEEEPDETVAPAPLLERRPFRIALMVAAGAAVLGGSAVLGFVVARGATDAGAAPAPVAATPGCEDVVEDGMVRGSGPGSLGSPAGTVLAFDHAYYVDRSAEKAFRAVAPSSRMTEEQLRAEGIDRLAEGTRHCVQVSEIAPTLLEVELTEFPPDSEPVVIHQRIKLAENGDGTWGIVSITPAG